MLGVWRKAMLGVCTQTWTCSPCTSGVQDGNDTNKVACVSENPSLGDLCNLPLELKASGITQLLGWGDIVHEHNLRSVMFFRSVRQRGSYTELQTFFRQGIKNIVFSLLVYLFLFLFVFSLPSFFGLFFLFSFLLLFMVQIKRPKCRHRCLYACNEQSVWYEDYKKKQNRGVFLP